jgi:hypothetical protein
MSKKQENDYESLAITCLAGVGGLALSSTFPFLILPSAMAMIGSVGLVIYEQFDKHKNRMWEVLGLVTKDDKAPICIKKRKVSTGEERVYHLPNGLSYKQIVAKKDEIENILKGKVKIELADNYNVVITTISSKYKKQYQINLKDNLLDGMKFHLGIDLDGKPIILDLSGNEMHTGVFGSTGSGKSVSLNILMAQFILKNIAVSVIDLKGGVEFSMYRKYNKLRDLAITTDEAEKALIGLVDLMNKRYKILLDAECKSYKDYDAKYKGKMPPIVLIVDEYNALVGSEYKDANRALFELLSRARACNIICIISTQRPSHDILSGNIKCNIKNFITFKVENEVDSEIVLSQKGNYRAFADLKSEGEGLLKTKGKITEFKGYYLSDKEILEQIVDKLNKKQPIQSFEKVIKTKTTTKEDIIKIDNLI